MSPIEHVFLDDAGAVARYLAELSSEPALAVDLEADSLHSYREKVCLIQISSARGHAVLDPLAAREGLEGLGRLLADPTVSKVFHGADYDVRLLKKDHGFPIRNLFDTMIAAQFTGRSQFGLAALLEEHFGVRLDKRHQRADWSARPLTVDMLAYAVLDTAYLMELRARLEGELAALGRLDWVKEECELLEAAEPAAERRPWCLDVKGASRLRGLELAVLQELLELRDRVARERDQPPFKVFGNQVLLDWAQRPPAGRREVLETPGAHKGTLDRFAPAILDAVRRARALPPSDWPRAPQSAFEPLTGSQERRLKRLKKVREEAAESLKLPPGLLVNSATLERLARKEPGDAEVALPEVLKRWQFQVLGEGLGGALRGEG